jgi:chromosome segregation ATPase
MRRSDQDIINAINNVHRKGVTPTVERVMAELGKGVGNRRVMSMLKQWKNDEVEVLADDLNKIDECFKQQTSEDFSELMSSHIQKIVSQIIVHCKTQSEQKHNDQMVRLRRENDELKSTLEMLQENYVDHEEYKSNSDEELLEINQNLAYEREKSKSLSVELKDLRRARLAETSMLESHKVATQKDGKTISWLQEQLKKSENEREMLMAKLLKDS